MILTSANEVALCTTKDQRRSTGDEPYVFISPITENNLLLRADTDI